MIRETEELSRQRELTDRAMLHPQVGDHFHEMYSWHIFVLDVAPDGGPVTVAEQDSARAARRVGGGLTFPDDARLRRFDTAAAFRSAYAYNTIPGYSIHYSNRVDVKGWLAYLQGRA